jgi:chromosome segregation ATPase
MAATKKARFLETLHKALQRLDDLEYEGVDEDDFHNVTMSHDELTAVVRDSRLIHKAMIQLTEKTGGLEATATEAIARAVDAEGKVGALEAQVAQLQQDKEAVEAIVLRQESRVSDAQKEYADLRKALQETCELVDQLMRSPSPKTTHSGKVNVHMADLEERGYL